jgi:hypothetical protein
MTFYGLIIVSDVSYALAVDSETSVPIRHSAKWRISED